MLSIPSTGEDKAANGDLDITSGKLKIVHPGRGTATIDAKGIDRVFDIDGEHHARPAHDPRRLLEQDRRRRRRRRHHRERRAR